MKVEPSNFRKKLQESGASRAGERTYHGMIGKVVNYHPNTGKRNPDGTYEGGICNCDRHQGSKMEAHEMHTVDVDVLRGTKMERLFSVPCFEYSQGLIDQGFRKNDRVWIQFINGDPSLPVVTAYYREPDSLDLFWNNLKFSVASIFDQLLPWNFD